MYSSVKNSGQEATIRPVTRMGVFNTGGSPGLHSFDQASSVSSTEVNVGVLH